MKKIIYTAITICLLLTTACDDYLGTDSPSRQTDETVYSTVYFTQSAVNGIYDRIADAQMYAQRVSINWSTNSDIEFVGADEKSYNQNSNRGVSNYYATADNAALVWTRIYQMIERANLIIKGIEDSPLLAGGTEKEKTAMMALRGEALTMRAMGYYELVKHWGDIPFKTEPTSNNLSNVYLDRTDRDVIYERLIEDLLDAEVSVPWVGESAGTVTYSSSEKISKGFIKGLIARICLSRAGYSLRDKGGYPMEQGENAEKYYKIANEKCNDVITRGLYSLKPNYVNIWKDVCALNADGANGENLYEVALGLGQSGEIGYSIGVRFYTNNKYGYNNNSNVVNTSAYYYYSFDKEDTRRDATIATAMYSNSVGEIKEFYQSNPLSYNFAKWDQRWMAENKTWLNYNMNAKNKWGYGVNWIVMRYADVLLMYAETENELNNGPTAAAKDALLQVRERAFAGTANFADKTTGYVNKLSGKENFFNAIVNERAWEFGGEGIRKFDLVRWNLLTAKIDEQKEAFNAMIDGSPVQIFDKEYTSFPKNLYYKYADDNENIDKNSINYYEDDPQFEGKSSDQIKAMGYTQVKWMTNFSDDNKKSYKERIRLFSSGLYKEYNGTCDNRYLYPIHTSVISDYQGLLKNSYGYK